MPKKQHKAKAKPYELDPRPYQRLSPEATHRVLSETKKLIDEGVTQVKTPKERIQ